MVRAQKADIVREHPNEVFLFLTSPARNQQRAATSVDIARRALKACKQQQI